LAQVGAPLLHDLPLPLGSWNGRETSVLAAFCDILHNTCLACQPHEAANLRNKSSVLKPNPAVGE
jgi:hypothetical protein